MRRYYRPFLIGVSLIFVNACGTLNNDKERVTSNNPLMDYKFESQLNYQVEQNRLEHLRIKQMVSKTKKGQ